MLPFISKAPGIWCGIKTDTPSSGFSNSYYRRWTVFTSFVDALLFLAIIEDPKQPLFM